VAVWAAQSPQAANEAFNITNGDVFEWRNVWPGIAETLGVEVGKESRDVGPPCCFLTVWSYISVKHCGQGVSN
jgi:hypothetical protein